MILFLAQLTGGGGTTRRLHARFLAPTNQALEARVERLDDGFGYDFAIQGFSVAPVRCTCPAEERSPGLYAIDIGPVTALTFPEGEYCVTLHDKNAGNRPVGLRQISLGWGTSTSGAASSPPPLDGPFRWFSY